MPDSVQMEYMKSLFPFLLREKNLSGLADYRF